MNNSDAELSEVVHNLLAGKLSATEFEEITQAYWASGHYIRSFHAVEDIAAHIRQRARNSRDSTYSVDGRTAKFSSQHLFGNENKPGAIHIVAPGETVDSEFIRDRNRPPHIHDSGRISVITQGSAVLYIHRRLHGEDYVIESRVMENDVIFWPPAVVHTFHAGTDGFSLMSAMARFMAPHQREFAIPADQLEPRLDLDAMPRIQYAEYLKSLYHITHASP
jgi:hypothetical protein